MTDKVDIYKALNAVMQEVGYVLKEKTAGLKYSYASEAALIAAIRPEMVKQGVVVHPGQVLELRQDTYTTRNGAVMNRTVVIMTYRFAHDESGTFIDVPVVGEGADVGDKSANKALTGAYKYALRQTLLIETGDDPDQFKSEPRGNGNAATVPAPAQNTTSTAPHDDKVQSTPTENGKVIEARAWLDGEASDGYVIFGYVADALGMAGLLSANGDGKGVRPHFKNWMKSDDCKHVAKTLKDRGYALDMRIKIPLKTALYIFDKRVEDKAVNDG